MQQNRLGFTRFLHIGGDDTCAHESTSSAATSGHHDTALQWYRHRPLVPTKDSFIFRHVTAACPCRSCCTDDWSMTTPIATKNREWVFATYHGILKLAILYSERKPNFPPNNNHSSFNPSRAGILAKCEAHSVCSRGNVKAKVSLCKAWRYVCCSGNIISRILNIVSRWVVSSTFQPLYPKGKRPRYPKNRRMGKSQSRLRYF